jgi:hypothetical protein
LIRCRDNFTLVTCGWIRGRFGINKDKRTKTTEHVKIPVFGLSKPIPSKYKDIDKSDDVAKSRFEHGKSLESVSKYP